MPHLTPSQKGAAAEAFFAAAAIQLGLTVLRPLSEGRRYDLVVDLEPNLLRVQCKSAHRLDGALSIRLDTNRCTPRGYVSTSYDASEIDAIGAYSPHLGSCYLIPIAVASRRRVLHMRTAPARNNQLAGVKWARDYELARVIERLRSGSTTALDQAR